MKNADMPAMANDLDVDTACGMAVFEGSLTVEKLGKWRAGLTKREHIAAMAMNGLMSMDIKGRLGPRATAAGAVKYADALLEALEAGT